jgi:uncharacterized protein YjbI with pentapeptide repeats
MISVTLFEAELTRLDACARGMVLFHTIRTLAGRKRSIKVRNWTILHQLWAATEYPSFYGWAHDQGLLPQITMQRANLYWANLYGANLAGANLSGANLAGAYLSGANLYGANLAGADLTNAIGCTPAGRL